MKYYYNKEQCKPNKFSSCLQITSNESGVNSGILVVENIGTYYEE